MNAARRNKRRRDWPRGLYESRPGYLIWRHPDGRTLAIGRVPLAVAVADAIAANAHVAGQLPNLVERLTGASNTVAHLLDKMPAAENKNTAKSQRSLDKQIRAGLGAQACADLTVKTCAEFLDTAAGARTAQALRSRLVAVLRRGQALGWLDSNPAAVTTTPAVKTQRQRLTLDAFKAIYAVADQVAEWLPLAMRLALVTGADRSTIAGLQRAMVADGHLTYRRGKTGAWIAVPLALRLDCMGWTLADVVAHRTGVLSLLLVHHVNPYGNAPAGSKVHPDRISHSFTAARKLAGIPDGNAVTFHELRSLSKRLYETQGGVDTVALLGHATARMAEMYANPRGIEPVRVKIG